MADTGEHGPDDQRLLAPDQIRQVTRRHLHDKHHHAKQRLQNEHVLHGEPFALKERYRHGHDHQKHLEEPEPERAQEIALELARSHFPCLLSRGHPHGAPYP